MDAHFRVLVDDPKVDMGQLPGAGGTQRLPRLIGAAAVLSILLDGARLSGRAALDARMIDALVPAGTEIAAAEAWLRSAPDSVELEQIPINRAHSLRP